MNPSIEELNNMERYQLIETISYKNMLPFIWPYLKPKNTLMISFYLFNIVLIVILAGLLVYNSMHHFINSKQLSFCFVGGSVVSVFLVPLHELLHGMSFKIMGAKKLTFGANFHEMVFYVTSDRFVLNKQQFYLLALTPFVVITAIGIPLLLLGSFLVQLFSSYVILFHTTCCIGDFALISYFIKNASKLQAYTYDEVESQTSYFFIKK